MHPQQLLGPGIALISKGNVPLFLIYFIITLRINTVLTHFGRTNQLTGNVRCRSIFFLGTFNLPRNNQRRASFIDKNRIDFVNNAKMEIALHHFGDVIRHVVAQVIKAQL